MIQKRYILPADQPEDERIAGLASAVAADLERERVRQALLIVYAPEWDEAVLRRSSAALSGALPNVSVVGATTLGSDNPRVALPSAPIATLLIFQSASFDVKIYDCSELTPRQSGVNAARRIANDPFAKAMLLLTADVNLFPQEFIDEVHDARPDVIVFGEAAGKSTLNAPDDSRVWAGGVLIRRGIVAVTFSGQDLQVEAEHNLGWRPIGRTMTATHTEYVGGVLAIDNMPALDVYRRYLGVSADAHFYDNVCAFPLVMRSGERLVARVPYDYDEHGALLFSMRMNENEPFTLSYSRPEYVLQESLDAANHMARFEPEALLMFACVNRRIYMGNERADREFGYYRQVRPECTWAYGAGEILQDRLGGGVLNSSLVAVGMREGGPAAAEVAARQAGEPAITDESLVLDHSYMTLSERLVTFLEETTNELNSTIDQLEILAERDELTGLYNRRRTELALEDALRRRTDDAPLTVLMYDIDYFKQVNDNHGHDAGDVVLRELSAVAREQAEEGCVLGRWGGEEFLVICPDTTLDAGVEMAERIRMAVSKHNFDGLGVGQVTISVGVAEAWDDDDASTLFSLVDSALYQAKRGGRNRVCVA